MARRSEFVEFAAERMAAIDRPRLRPMFGGFGVYRNDRIFALIVDDRLYLKANAATRGAFEREGLRPFTYVVRNRLVTMPYFEAPPEVFEDPDAMRWWMQTAYEAAWNDGRAASAATPARCSKPRRGPRRRRRAPISRA